jgi:hypothetical protein
MKSTEPTSQDFITPAELVARVRAAAEQRLRSRAPEPPPQALYPVERIESWEPFPWRRSSGEREPFQLREASVLDFVSLEPRRFVAYCFQILLGRSPEPGEARLWLERLARGWPRIAAVATIRWSPEGRRHGVRLRGVWVRIAIDLSHFARARLLRSGPLRK